jgi:trans-aconitate methyltransferase
VVHPLLKSVVSGPSITFADGLQPGISVTLPFMTEENAAEPPEIDITVAHPARMYDYYLGGKTHFAADREAAGKVLAVLPEGRDMAVANRAFLVRVVRFLASQGISQFLDIGTGIPSPGSTSEILHAIDPDARVVYVDNDPIVIAHARALLRDGGPVTVIHGDLREPEKLLADPGVAAVLDFSKPVAILLVAVLHFIRDREEPERIVQVLKNAMPPGSYLAISHGTQDFNPERANAAVRGYDEATAPFVLRSRERVESFFAGLDLVQPGVVQLPSWRPDGGGEGDPSKIWLYAGVGHKRSG